MLENRSFGQDCNRHRLEGGSGVGDEGPGGCFGERTAIQNATRGLHLPPSIATSFQGSVRAFQSSLSSTPILTLAALIAVYRASVSERETCHLRLRPMMMTTICALLAGVPLMVGTGIGSEIRQPLGHAIVGGLLVSQVLSLFTTPVVYIYTDHVGHWLGRRQAANAEAGIVVREADAS